MDEYSNNKKLLFLGQADADLVQAFVAQVIMKWMMKGKQGFDSHSDGIHCAFAQFEGLNSISCHSSVYCSCEIVILVLGWLSKGK